MCQLLQSQHHQVSRASGGRIAGSIKHRLGSQKRMPPRNEERERANDARSAIQWNPYLRVLDCTQLRALLVDGFIIELLS